MVLNISQSLLTVDVERGKSFVHDLLQMPFQPRNLRLRQFAVMVITGFRLVVREPFGSRDCLLQVHKVLCSTPTGLARWTVDEDAIAGRTHVGLEHPVAALQATRRQR